MFNITALITITTVKLLAGSINDDYVDYLYFTYEDLSKSSTVTTPEYSVTSFSSFYPVTIDYSFYCYNKTMILNLQRDITFIDPKFPLQIDCKATASSYSFDVTDGTATYEISYTLTSPR